jgi:MFS family permease
MLHLTQMAVFVAVPHVLQSALGLPLAQHGWVYLPVLLGSFVVMVPGMVWAERRGQTKPLKLLAIGLMVFVLLGLAVLVQWPVAQAGTGKPWGFYSAAFCFLLFAYFVAFNVLEAVLPSWVSRVAPPERRGAAMGVYNTAQALGLFTGGALGGMLYQHVGAHGVFLGALGCVLLWLLWAAQLPRLPVRKP